MKPRENTAAGKITVSAKEAIGAHRAARNAWERVVAEFRLHIQGLPDNPKIVRRFDGPMAMVISSSAFAATGSWSIFTQDFKQQRKRLLEHADGIAEAPAKQARILREILESGNEKISGGHLGYHPDVLAASRAEILALVEAAGAVFGLAGTGKNLGAATDG